MSIDVTIPALLLARGLGRREAAAALRDLSGRKGWGTNYIAEADHVLKHTLGTRWFLWHEGWLAYDIPLAEGVSLVRGMDRRGNVARTERGTLTPGDDFIVMDGEMPETVINSLSGGKLDEILRHPQIPSGIDVDTIENIDGRAWIRIKPVRSSATLVLPASQWDMVIAKAGWRRLRTRQLREARAIQGIGLRSLIRSVIRLLLTAVILITAWLIMDNPIGRHPTWAMTAVAAIMLWLSGGLYRDAMEADDHLLPRLDAMRHQRVEERRQSITRSARA